MTSTHSAPRSSAVGPLLQYWRKTRSLSQLALAHEADVSPRHICFLETGRAKPSREMVVLLSNVLGVPLRERNAMLLAAGFAPLYAESPLDAPELRAVQTALHAILRQQEPFPAVVMNRHWDLVKVNEAARRFFGLLLGDRAAAQPANVVRLMFDPHGLRPCVDNWDLVAETLLQRVHREAVGGVPDATTDDLIAEVLAYPGVPKHLRRLNLAAPSVPVIPICFRKGDHVFNYFSAVTTLGTPQDVTLQELRIECFFPADSSTQARARALRDGTP
ncbi:helix-turn-helix transcriptional regulator [Aquincola sp. S2]|uniref:Helix-turn-helix transcriptional regulator n=1 Tax=Pseudaquabacterium terrae TaxID=2732868 RepID=A0ABX2EAQ5_9BURK|nr:helix-turn-helix domain-containing protein [Aquabacterium terrae]NRF65933.1 helix-turn-helix transcriptional regulator [Aquabacterium terrae]